MQDQPEKSENQFTAATAKSIRRSDRRSKLALLLSSVSVIGIGLIAINSFFGPIRIVIGEGSVAAAPAPVAAVPPASGTLAPASVAAQQAPAVITADSVAVVTVENKPYAYDATTGSFFVFDDKMNAIAADRSQIPPQAAEQLLSGRVPPAVVGNTDAAFQKAQATNQAIAEGNDLKINVLLADKEVAEKTLAAFDRAAGVDTNGDAGLENRVYVFFDPTCPWCHKLYQDMDGKVDAKWLPTLALGNAGIPLVNYIMGTGGVTLTKNADGKQAVTVSPDPNRSARLREVVGEGARPKSQPEATPETSFITEENETLMLFLYGNQTHLQGVPTIVVALPGGGAKVLNGYEPTTVSEILKLQGKR